MAKYKIIIEYLPKYKVKYSIINTPIKEDDGGGWYCTVGHKLICIASMYKETQSTTNICQISDLPENIKELFDLEKLNYESSKIHKQRLQSFTQLALNNGTK